MRSKSARRCSGASRAVFLAIPLLIGSLTSCGPTKPDGPAKVVFDARAGDRYWFKNEGGKTAYEVSATINGCEVITAYTTPSTLEPDRRGFIDYHSRPECGWGIDAINWY